MNIFHLSLAVMITAFILDRIFGDPYKFPHIVRWMGNLINILERIFRPLFPATEKGEKLAGTLLAIIMIFISASLPLTLLFFLYTKYPLIGFLSESLICWQCLSAKSLKVESMKVYTSLKNDDIEGGRKNLSMIVGRDTRTLDKDGVIRAAVETVAENTSDGLIAPLMYMALGGAPLACLYKAVNTMDSMIAYKNERYINFGCTAAKIDDLLNYIPSRLAAFLMVLSTYLLRFDGKEAYRIWKRDGRKHASPNSGHTEAACAGALGIQLGGPNYYFGQLKDKPYIGDKKKAVDIEDISSANRLLYLSSNLMLVLSVACRLLFLEVII